MKFQEILNTVQNSNGKTVLFHCCNWPDVIWVAFKNDEYGNPVFTIFLRKDNGKFAVVNGARFTNLEVVDVAAEWEVEIL